MGTAINILITKLRASVDRVTVWAGKVDACLTLILTGFISYSVFVRYFLNRPLWWVEEVTAYIWIYIAALSFPYATMLESHVASDIIFVRFPAKLKYLITVGGYLMALIVCSVMVLKGISIMKLYYILDWRSDSLLEVPLWIIWVSVPVGFLLMGLQVVSKIYVITQRQRRTGSVEVPKELA